MPGRNGLIAVSPGMYQFYHQRNATIRSIAPKVRIVKNLVIMSLGLTLAYGKIDLVIRLL